MKTEFVNKIVLNGNNELFLILESNGNPMYQYVYREAAGVYWDDVQKGFKSTPIMEWTITEWYLHIKEIIKTSLNIDLILSEDLIWDNIPEVERIKIKNAL